jgi:pheromone shutdown-related protein TraB
MVAGIENLTIVGTSHIAFQSVDEIQQTFEQVQPDIIALELDYKRMYSLTHKPKKRGPSILMITRIGLQGFLFSVIGQYVQKKLGDRVGIQPGSEMLTGLNLARQHTIPVALIDQDIEITMRRLSKAIGWRERFRIFKDIVTGALFGKKEMQELGIESIDLARVPEPGVVDKLIGELERRYPALYRVLVEERNRVMARNLGMLMMRNPGKKILAVVGAGHEDELRELVQHYLGRMQQGFAAG